MKLLYSAAPDWQTELRRCVDDPAELLALLELSDSLLDGAKAGHQDFALRVPRPWLNRIKKGDPDDPLLRQILPLADELLQVPGFNTDPLAEADANHASGLIHKYTDRVLLILSGACAINCRYCFRRHFPYGDNQLGPSQWQAVLDYLQQHPQVSEVIFSGGDPLVTPDGRLQRMLNDLSRITHLKRIRIHSRLPVVIPQRVTDTLIDALTSTRLQPVLVVHVNHPQEVDAEVDSACRRLRQAGITLLNQTVLLRYINDNKSVQKMLSERLFSCGVLPYYLFVLDPVAGAAHFDIDDQQARRLVGELQSELPGYLVPRLAREIPGRPSKTLLLPQQPGQID
jgi:EF-P beta-lysylation protein EpmB